MLFTRISTNFILHFYYKFLTMEEKEEKSISGIAIVGYNLLSLLVYTVIFRLIGGAGFILFGLIFLCHFVMCLLLTFSDKKHLYWLLSAVIVLIVGISTCSSGGDILH